MCRWRYLHVQYKCVCSVCSGHSLVFRHHWVINIISQHGCDQSVCLKKPFGVYHTCLCPKQQAESSNEHQRTLRSLPHSHYVTPPPSDFFSPSALLDLPLSLLLMLHSSCGIKKIYSAPSAGCQSVETAKGSSKKCNDVLTYKACVKQIYMQTNKQTKRCSAKRSHDVPHSSTTQAALQWQS